MIQYNKTSTKLENYELDAIQNIIESGNVVNGYYVGILEEYFRSKFNVKYAIACANCTSGLTIALRASEIVGKTVALPAFTWHSTKYAIECSGNIPIFCDIDRDTWLIDIDTCDADVIMPVDTFGNQVNITSTKPVIYDAAHGIFLPLLGKRGLVEVISMSFTKNITAMQGGMLLTNDDIIAKKASDMINKYAKLGEVSAVVALNSIQSYKKLDKNFIINVYRDLITVPFIEQKVPTVTNRSVFAVLFESNTLRNKIYNNLKNNGIETKIYYEPVERGLPITEDVYSRILALPVYNALNVDTIKFICEVINDSYVYLTTL